MAMETVINKYDIFPVITKVIIRKTSELNIKLPIILIKIYLLYDSPICRYIVTFLLSYFQNTSLLSVISRMNIILMMVQMNADFIVYAKNIDSILKIPFSITSELFLYRNAKSSFILDKNNDLWSL